MYTWTSHSIPSNGRRLTVATTAKASRRLTFSSCDDLPVDTAEETDSDYSSSTTYDGELCAELTARNTELETKCRRQNDKLSSKDSLLDEANYEIEHLKTRISSLENQNRSSILSVEREIAEYRKTTLLQAEDLECTKLVLNDKTAKLADLEKNFASLKKDYQDSLAELAEACDTVQFYQKNLLTVKGEHQAKQQAARRQRDLDAEKIQQIEQENSLLTCELAKLRDAFVKLEREKTDLQQEIVQAIPKDNGTHLLHQLEVDNMDEDSTFNPEALLVNMFPSVDTGMSLFSELQSSLGSQFAQPIVSEMSTQTEDEVPDVPATPECVVCSNKENQDVMSKVEQATKCTQTLDATTVNRTPVVSSGGECTVMFDATPVIPAATLVTSPSNPVAPAAAPVTRPAAIKQKQYHWKAKFGTNSWDGFSTTKGLDSKVIPYGPFRRPPQSFHQVRGLDNWDFMAMGWSNHVEWNKERPRPYPNVSWHPIGYQHPYSSVMWTQRPSPIWSFSQGSTKNLISLSSTTYSNY